MFWSYSQPLASERREIIYNQNFEEKEDYETNSKRLTMRKNRTLTKKKDFLHRVMENPGAKILEGGRAHKDNWQKISPSRNSLGVSTVSHLKGDTLIRSSKDTVKSCGQCDLVRMDNSNNSEMGFKQRLIYSTVFLLVSTHLMLLVTNTIETVAANPAVGSLQVLSTTGAPRESDNSPHFDVYRVENHTVQLGGIAFLPCIIKNLGNKSVSWIRGRDSHILTVDREVFITDRRFSTIHRKDSATWTLQIKSVQAHDAGKYECQISTEPKLSHFVFLTVIVPRVRIFGDRDIFVKSSSTVQLKCVISQSLSPPTYIEWLRNDEERLPSSFLGVSSSASFDQNRRMSTTQPEHIAEGTTMSTLSILNAKPSDSGKYTCKPAQLEQASVNLHVLESDLPALMQTSQANPSQYSCLFLLLISLMVSHLASGGRGGKSHS